MQVSKEAEAERKAQAASKAASEATQKVRDAARQLSEGRARTERLERAQEALILERNNALDEVCCLLLHAHSEHQLAAKGPSFTGPGM